MGERRIGKERKQRYPCDRRNIRSASSASLLQFVNLLDRSKREHEIESAETHPREWRPIFRGISIEQNRCIDSRRERKVLTKVESGHRREKRMRVGRLGLRKCKEWIRIAVDQVPSSTLYANV